MNTNIPGNIISVNITAALCGDAESQQTASSSGIDYSCHMSNSYDLCQERMMTSSLMMMSSCTLAFVLGGKNTLLCHHMLLCVMVLLRSKLCQHTSPVPTGDNAGILEITGDY